MSPSQHEAALAAVPILSGLSKRQLKKLLDASRVVEHHSGREIASEGEGALALHIILSGAASVSVGGRLLRTLGPGDYFGEVSLIDGKRRSATVAAVEPLTALVVPHLAFQRLLDEDPACARTMLVALCSRLREAESRT